MIRHLLAGLTLALGMATAGKTPASGPVHVSGYTKANGTYVAPYYRRAPGTATSSYTAPTVRTYSSCADARAAGRWNILITDSDYSPALDRDSDGIACEAGSDGSSTGRDPDPVGTVSTVPATVPYAPTAWAVVGQTYPEWLGRSLAWAPNTLVCAGDGHAYEQAMLNDGTGTVPAWRGTLGFIAGLSMATDTERVGAANAANNVSASAPWTGSVARTGRRVWLPDAPDIAYAIEMRAMGDSQAVVCVTTLEKR